MDYQEIFYVLQNEEGKFLVDDTGSGMFWNEFNEAIRYNDHQDIKFLLMHKCHVPEFDNLKITEVKAVYTLLP